MKENEYDAAAYRVLVCGAGRVAREVIKRLAESWRVTLIDKSGKAIGKAKAVLPDPEAVYQEDASSPVVLEKAGLAEHDYVLALTGDDAVNLAVAREARSKDIRHVLCVANDSENADRFEELEVVTVRSGAMLAQWIHHYLQDPRIQVTPLVGGAGSIFEVDAADHFRVVGKRSSYFRERDRRLVGVIRGGTLFFPNLKTEIKAGDRLIILGRPESYQEVCSLLDCGNPHFPLAYGQGLLLALPLDDEEKDQAGALGRILNKGLFLTQNTKVKKTTILTRAKESRLTPHLREWPHTGEVEILPIERNMLEQVQELCKGDSYGLVVLPPFEASFLRTLTGRPTMVAFARRIETPLLIARFTLPYKRILVPFNGTAMAELALEIAVDMARQLDSEIAVAVVEEPEVVSGAEGREAAEGSLERIREMAHIHKTQFKEVRRRGNPVKEITALSKDHDLLILGSTNAESGLFSPNVGEHIASKAACSVLIVTA